MLVAVVILLVLIMSGLAVVMVYALRADIRIGRDSWRRLNRNQRSLQLVAIVAWFVGLAMGFGIGYAIGGNWQSGIGGAVVLAFELAVIGPLVILGGAEGLTQSDSDPAVSDIAVLDKQSRNAGRTDDLVFGFAQDRPPG